MGDIYDTGGIVSSAGRRLQGAVIERATGTDYADALRERILVSLGLEATFFPGWSDRWRTCHGPSGRRGGVRRGCGYVGWTRGAWRIWRHRRDRGRHGSLRTRPVPRFAALRRRPRTLLDFDATHGLPETDDCDGDLYATAEDGNEPASADRDVHDGIDPGLVTRRLVGGVGAQLPGAHSRPLRHQCRG
jgi:CubicO group peptidase (beta-lactamase class C family)